jgi:hypothetical protein
LVSTSFQGGSGYPTNYNTLHNRAGVPKVCRKVLLLDKNARAAICSKKDTTLVRGIFMREEF